MRVMQHMLKRILHRLNMSILPRFVDIYPPNILQQLKHSHSWTPAWQPASGYEAKLQSQKKSIKTTSVSSIAYLIVSIRNLNSPSLILVFLEL